MVMMCGAFHIDLIDIDSIQLKLTPHIILYRKNISYLSDCKRYILYHHKRYKQVYPIKMRGD